MTSLMTRFSTPDDYTSYAALSHAAFGVPLSSELRMLAGAVDPRQILLGEYEGKVVCQIFLHRLNCWINGKLMPLGGLAGLTTDPDFRSRGFATRILQVALEEMRAEGIPLAGLYPTTYSLYNRAGWAFADTSVKYAGPGTAFASRNVDRRFGAIEHRALLRRDQPILANIRHLCGSLTNGFIERDDLSWRLRVFDDFAESARNRVLVLHNGEQDEPDGYACYSRACDGPITVHDIVVVGAQALDSVLHTLAREAGSCPLEFILGAECPLLARTSDPIRISADAAPRLQAMHRIVDFPSALERRCLLDPTAQGRCVLRIQDSTCPWNHGDWFVQWAGGDISCTKVTDKEIDAVIDIRALVRLYLAAVSVQAAIRFGEVRIVRPTVIQALRSLFAGISMPFSGDHF